MLSCLKDVLNDFLGIYPDLSEYVDVLNIGRRFHGEPALNKWNKQFNWISTISGDQTKPDIQKMYFAKH